MIEFHTLITYEHLSCNVQGNSNIFVQISVFFGLIIMKVWGKVLFISTCYCLWHNHIFGSI